VPQTMGQTSCVGAPGLQWPTCERLWQSPGRLAAQAPDEGGGAARLSSQPCDSMSGTEKMADCGNCSSWSARVKLVMFSIVWITLPVSLPTCAGSMTCAAGALAGAARRVQQTAYCAAGCS